MKQTLNVDDVRAMMRQRIAEAGSQAQWAQTIKLSQAYISDALNGNREPGQSILDALNLVRVVAYRRKV